MTDGLGPCPTPWCEPEHEKYTWQGPDDLFCVICDGCQVEGPHCEDEGDAQAAWNTRASLAAQDGLVEALEKVRKCAIVVPSIFPDTPPSVSWIVSELTKILPEMDAALSAIKGDK